MSPRRLALLLCFATLPPLRAQEPQPGPQPDPDQVVHIRGVEVRRPDAMHPGPIELIGIEQGTNSFRSSTPALSMGNTAPKLIDPDELYRSRMAMYGEPGFEAPAPAVETDGPRRHGHAPAADQEPVAGPSAGTIALVLVVVAVGAMGLRRLRQVRA